MAEGQSCPRQQSPLQLILFRTAVPHGHSVFAGIVSHGAGGSASGHAACCLAPDLLRYQLIMGQPAPSHEVHLARRGLACPPVSPPSREHVDHDNCLRPQVFGHFEGRGWPCLLQGTNALLDRWLWPICSRWKRPFASMEHTCREEMHARVVEWPRLKRTDPVYSSLASASSLASCEVV